MSVRTTVLGVAAMLLLGTVLVGQSPSQTEEPGSRRGGRQAREGREGERGPRYGRIAERIKETLAVSEEEWKVLEPRVTKVIGLSREVRGVSGLRMQFRRGAGREGARAEGRREGGPEGRREGRPEGRQGAREQTEAGKAMEELGKTLDNKEATPEQIKEKLAAFRTAREKAMKELAKAQKELREGLSVRHEAQLVLVGLLD